MSGTTVPVPVGELVQLRDELAETGLPWALGWSNILNEALSIAEDHAGPDFEALLDELIKELALHSGRHFVPTLDRAGVDAALAVLADMAPALGALTETKDWLPLLCEAVKVQDLTVTLEIYSGARSDNVVETIADYPVPRIPVRDDEIMLEDRRLLSVTWVRLVGRAAVVRAKHWGRQPKPEEKF